MSSCSVHLIHGPSWSYSALRLADPASRLQESENGVEFDCKVRTQNKQNVRQKIMIKLHFYLRELSTLKLYNLPIPLSVHHFPLTQHSHIRPPLSESASPLILLVVTPFPVRCVPLPPPSPSPPQSPSPLVFFILTPHLPLFVPVRRSLSDRKGRKTGEVSGGGQGLSPCSRCPLSGGTSRLPRSYTFFCQAAPLPLPLLNSHTLSCQAAPNTFPFFSYSFL